MSNQHKSLKKSTGIKICSAEFFIAFASVPAHLQQATVCLNTPELVKENTVYAALESEVIGDRERNLLISSGLPGITKASQIDTDRGVTTATDVQESTPGSAAVFSLMGLSRLSVRSGSVEN